MPDCAILIAAAGRGERFGAAVPKQYADFADGTVLARAVCAFKGFGRTVCIIDPADRPLYEAAVVGLDLDPPVPGGRDRQTSILNGLNALAERGGPEFVLIHDAARPSVPREVIGRVIDALADADGAVPGLPVADTIKRVEGGRITATPSRDGLWRAQTPQGFRFAAILEAHRAAAGGTFTDDAAVAEAAGLEVAMVRGDRRLEKITEPEDADAMRAGGEVRTGQGFDVHRLVPGAAVTLCGVTVPHDRALSGHSDADVGLHALTDAVLGALAEGDIGLHFPPGDPTWRGAASERFLRHACELVRARGGRLVHCDVTLICEAPRIGPHREAMRVRIAGIAGVAEDRVSVKATTTEGLGLTGRREGIAAQATASVWLP